jgi:RHH-type rel operon transcriptional repressor/antitoxin RelB
MTAVSVRLPDDVANRLSQLAALTGRSKSFYITEAILEHLDDLEDIYLAEKRLEDIRAGRTTTVPLAEVMKRYGLEDWARPGGRAGAGQARPSCSQAHFEVSA